MKVLSVAPTGKAAFNIDGNTIHSALHIPFTQQKKAYIPLTNDLSNTLHSKYFDIDVMICDEYSMVGSNLFNQCNSRLQQIFKSKEIFGGKSVILFGDLAQLPPVGDSWIFQPNFSQLYSEILGSFVWDLFKHYELTEIMRQQDDKIFSVALNHLSKGELKNEEYDLFCNRESTLSEVPSDAIHLVCTNEEVNYYNIIKLNEIEG